MAKKKRLIPVLVIILIFVLLIVGFFASVRRGYCCSVGRYLETSNGTGMVVLENSPVEMCNQTNWDLFGGLTTGDKILVIHDGMDLSYPGRTGVYAVLKLSNGNADDIPPTVVNSLIELGWLTTQ